MKEIFAGITWASFEYAPVGLCLVLALVVGIKRIKRVRATLHLLQPQQRSVSLVAHASYPRAIIKSCLFMAALVGLWLALLRPQWNTKEEVFTQEGRDLLIALDVSRSMMANDVAPNRLELTKQKIRSLVKRLKSDRVGLLLFSGDAFVQCPLTNDYGAFFMFLDQVSVETISSGSTAIEGALRKSLELFKQAGERKNKLIALFTDGEDFSTNLGNIRHAAQHEHVILFTLGVGTPDGSPIPLFDAQGKQVGHQKNQKGSVVISRLNEPLLQELARETGGTYLRLQSKDDSDIDVLVNKVTHFEKEAFDDTKMSQLEDQYPYFLMVSFICLALDWLL